MIDYSRGVAAPIGPGGQSILIFEGLFLFRRELNACWDFRILLDVDAATSLSRALDRDTDVIGPADLVPAKYESDKDSRDFLHPNILKPPRGGGSA